MHTAFSVASVVLVIAGVIAVVGIAILVLVRGLRRHFGVAEYSWAPGQRAGDASVERLTGSVARGDGPGQPTARRR